MSAPPAGSADAIAVVLVDDSLVYRAGLRAVLEAAEDIVVVGEAPDGEAALEVLGTVEPDVVFLDGDLPGTAEICQRIRHARPAARVVVMTDGADRSALVASTRAGAVGYLLKETPPEHLREAVRQVAGGGSPIDPRIAGSLLAELATLSRVAATEPWGGLTERQIEVLRLIMTGLSNKEIGERLYISEFTVKNHVRAILDRLGLSSRVEAAAWAARAGLLVPEHGGRG